MGGWVGGWEEDVLDIGVGEDELANLRVEGKAVHAVAHGKDKDGGGGVHAVARGDQVLSGLI